MDGPGLLGETPKDRPVTPADIHHTIYRVLGVDPHLGRKGRGHPWKGRGHPLLDVATTCDASPYQ
jgi:hypothetical protein